MEVDGDQFPRGESESEPEINIEFPTELIPDEYEHENGSNGVVYIFSDNNGKPLADKLLDSLEVHGYNIPQENQYIISEVKETYSKMTQLAHGNFTEKTCLMVILIGSSDIYKELSLHTETSKIWSPFINNEELKFKPKIFMFFEYTEEDPTTTDYSMSKKRFNRDEPYDIPSEADVLIMYQKSEDISIKKGRLGFLMEFCENLKNHGERDDIIDLLTRSQSAWRPLIISTLRKKFYATSSSFREHFFDIQTNIEEMLKILDSLKERLLKVTTGSSRTSQNSSTATTYKASNSMQRSSTRSRNNMVTTDGKRSVHNISNVTKRGKKEASKPMWKP